MYIQGIIRCLLQCRSTLFLVLLCVAASMCHAAFPATVSVPACTSNCYEYQEAGAMNYPAGNWVKDPVAAANHLWPNGYYMCSHQGQLISITNVTSGKYATFTVKVYPSAYWGYETCTVALATRLTAAYPASYSCPANSMLSGSQCSCNLGYAESNGACVPPCPAGSVANPLVSSRCGVTATLKANGHQCPATPFPITIGNGNKWLREVDAQLGILSFARYYNSNPNTLDSWVGRQWQHEFGQWLSAQSSVVTAHRPDGRVLSFTVSGTSFTPEIDMQERLSASRDATGAVSAFYLKLPLTLETYSPDGRLQSITGVDGSRVLLTYASEKLWKITDAASRRFIELTYDLSGRIVGFIDPMGQSTTYGYDTAGNLTTVSYPGGTSRSYVYGESLYTSGATLPTALTGVVDENGDRTLTYQYDASGRAIGEFQEGVGGAFLLDFGSPDATTVTEPSGASRVAGFVTIANVPRLVSLSQPAGSGCGASSSNISYDEGANVLSRDDFTGVRTCYGYDANHREMVRVEGLPTTAACTAVLTGTLPAGARRITSAWHPDWKLPTQIAQPGRRTTLVYHGQPDPFNGNALASCTSAPALPDGKPVAVLCKQVTQALLEDGTVDSGVAALVVSQIYDAAGRLLTRTDERGGQTTLQYWAATSFTGGVGQTAGDLKLLTNPAGQATNFDQFDQAGQVRRMRDPKGITTDITYTPRGWVNTVSVTPPGGSARVTTYSRDDAGQLTAVTQPDGTSLAYSHDAAHRLTGVTDERGNSVTYTLDASGNRIGEEIRDAGGTVRRSLSRSFDALNRLQQVTGGAQ